MFLPLHDGVPLKHMKTPVVTRAPDRGLHPRLSADLLRTDRPRLGGRRLRTDPCGVLRHGGPARRPSLRPVWMTLATSIFLHGSCFTSSATCCSSGSSATMSRTRWGMALPRLLSPLRLRGEPRPCLRRSGIRPPSHRRLRLGLGHRGGLSHPLSAGAGSGPCSSTAFPFGLPAYCAIGFWFVLQLVAAFLGGDEAWAGLPISAASSRAPS